jgi:c-di-GMP-binding flagellar brake protein YcgR
MAFQLQVSYLTTSDPKLAIVLLGVLGVLVAVLMIVNISKYGIGSSGMGRIKQDGAGKRINRGALKRAAASYGLDSNQVNFLDRLFRASQVSDPAAALSNQEVLDRHFKKAFRDIEASAETEAASEQEKALLFSIRNAVESIRGTSGRVVSTRRLPEGLAAVITGAKGETYPTRTLAIRNDRILVEAPKSALGDLVKFSRSVPITLSFYAKSSEGYKFQTSVLGTETTQQGPALVLAHSNSVSSLPTRRHRRKETRIPCYFSLVQVVQRNKDRSVVKETIVDNRRVMGTIVDISGGGCAVKSAAALKTGEFLKIEFEDFQGRSLAAFGRIVRTNRMGAVGGIMHIQFLKTTKKAINAINAIVYGYEQE